MLVSIPELNELNLLTDLKICHIQVKGWVFLRGLYVFKFFMFIFIGL